MVLGLLDEVHRAGVQRVKHTEVQRGDQDHGDRVLGDVFPQKLRSALARHLHVHSDDIRSEGRDLRLGVHGVDGVADDLDAGMGRKALHDHAAGHHGIIHHQHADLLIDNGHNALTASLGYFWNVAVASLR